MRAEVGVALLVLAMNGNAEEALPPGLLDFLGSMVESDGVLIDPILLETAVEGILSEPAVDEVDGADDEPPVAEDASSSGRKSTIDEVQR